MAQRSKLSPPKKSSVAAPAVLAVSTSLTESAAQTQPHELECRIQRRLQTHVGLKFARLTVHQCPQGVCLEGLLVNNDDGVDLRELVREIAGVEAINRVVMRPTLPK